MPFSSRPAGLFAVLACLLFAGCREPEPAPRPSVPTVPVQPVVEEIVSPDGRDPRPVVLTGEDLGTLLGSAPGDVVAFAFEDGAFEQIPVQVDERFAYDLAVVYDGISPRECARKRWCQDLQGHIVGLGYADPGTHVGPDPDATFDADDEVALMLADFGERAAGVPPGVEAASGMEVATETQGNTRYAYLFRRADPTLEPGAGRAYVRYTPTFLRGPYMDGYNWMGQPFRQAGPPGPDLAGSNPEQTAVETEVYTMRFADRWILHHLQIGDGPDVLDLDMIGFGLGVCERTPYTMSVAEGGFLVNRSGPVRALRHVAGANSGPLTESLWTFYARYAESRYALRVHTIPGMMTYLDLNPAAEGMVYRDAVNPEGARIDGERDSLRVGTPTWQTVSGDQGAWALHHEVTLEGIEAPPELFYFDERQPAEEDASCHFDGAYYGAHGLWVRGDLPSTDPRMPPTARAALLRRFVFGGDPEFGRRVLEAPLSVMTQAWRPTEG